MTQADDATTTPALTAADLDTGVNCEPRVLDTTVGKHLGMARPTNIRSQIEANRAELESFGPLHAARAKVGIGSGAKREVVSYYLNEGQTLCVCALSRAPNAPQVRRALIEAFMELRRRQVEALVSSEKTCALVAADSAGLPQVAAPPRPRLVDLFAWSCTTLAAWQDHGFVRDPDAALRIIHTAVLEVAGDDFVASRAPNGRRR